MVFALPNGGSGVGLGSINRQDNGELGPLAGFAGCIDNTTVVLYDLFADGQANTGTLVFRTAMEPLEDEEDLTCKFIFKADAIIPELDPEITVGGIERKVVYR